MKSENTNNTGVFRIAAFSALLWAGVFLFSAWAHDFNFSWFIHAGENYADRAVLPPGFDIVKDADGYDGQFYYRLAKNPFTNEKTAYGITLDAPALRHQRILYPLLVWCLSQGGRFFVPELLMLVNLASLIFLGWIGARLAVATGREPALGLLFSLFPGFLFSLRSDLTEPLAAALLASYLYLYMRGKPVAANAALALALLARESMAVVALGKTAELLFLTLFKRGDSRKELLLSLAPFVPFALLQAALYINWGAVPLFESGAHNVAAPGAGFFKYMNWLLFHSRDTGSAADFLRPAGVVIFMAAALAVSAKNRFSPLSHPAWIIAYGVLLFSLDSAWNPTFLRVFTDPFLLCSFVILSRGKPGVLEKALLMFAFPWFMAEVYNVVAVDYYFKTSYFGWK